MGWTVELHPLFAEEFRSLSEDVQDSLLAELGLLERHGPQLGRPHADTLNGSKHRNMKELRFVAGGGVWRTAFAFDSVRRAIILVAGDKSGISEKRFYKQLLPSRHKIVHLNIIEILIYQESEYPILCWDGSN